MKRHLEMLVEWLSTMVLVLCMLLSLWAALEIMDRISQHFPLGADKQVPRMPRAIDTE